MIKLITGSFMFCAGLFLTFTGVGALVGIPLFIGGLAMGAAGFASIGKTAVKTGMAVGKASREWNASKESNSGYTPAAAALPQTSVADEIAKLGELVKAGLLTEDEFSQKKAQLLSKSA